MRTLLDENLPHDLRHFLTEHEPVTVAYMGWSGVSNGKLLALAAAEGFDAVLSKDAGLEYEQQLTNLPLSVVLLQSKSNAHQAILPLLPRSWTHYAHFHRRRLFE